MILYVYRVYLNECYYKDSAQYAWDAQDLKRDILRDIGTTIANIQIAILHERGITWI